MPEPLRIVIAGQLRRQTILPPEGRPQVDTPGGNALYAATGARVWGETPALLARVGEDYPQAWIRRFQQLGLNISGVKILPEALDVRSFLAYTDYQTAQTTSPVSHFVRLGLSFPKTLLGYQPPSDTPPSRSRPDPDSPRLTDIPPAYLAARAVHICPLDFVTHSQLVPAFRQGGIIPVMLDPHPAYMTPTFFNDIRAMLQGLTAFIPSEKEIRALFWGRTDNIWDMAEDLASFGCDLIIIKRGPSGQFLYDHISRKRWQIPAYAAHLSDPTGAGDVFSGGFVAGYLQTLDPLQAVLRGNVAASLAIEGSGPFYALDAMPGLAEARLQSLAELIREA